MKKDIIWSAQVAALKEIEVNLKSLGKAVKETEQRIETNGIGHNFSENHDCYYYAVRVWKNSLRLAELKKLEQQLNGLNSLGIKTKGDKNVEQEE